MLLNDLYDRQLIHPPKWLPSNCHFLTMMGSMAYGVSSDSSDMDIYGWAIPPKEDVFPHLRGEIPGFGRQTNRFDQYQEHHIQDPTALSGKGREYDFSIYSIVKYFHLCMENNPNMIDSLFVPQTAILHMTRIGELVRQQRRSFLHKGCWHKFKGYAYSQLHKMSSKNPVGKRLELREKFGFDVKFGYHVVRLLSECEQILREGELDLQEKSRREHMKAIRRGDVSEDEIRRWATEKEAQLERLYESSSLPYGPDEKKIKDLLLHCLEEHYGSLDQALVRPDAADIALQEIAKIIDRYRR
ncbi:MAG: nucleotidyltransferase domain-containing protein [Planctomycetaceae bacterium]|nr:nucleotidyltransferase domain-containing protein [Planctomycetaceae bacterium]